MVYIAFLLMLGVVFGWGRMVAEATFFMVFLKFDNTKLFHIRIIWYICVLKLRKECNLLEMSIG